MTLPLYGKHFQIINLSRCSQGIVSQLRAILSSPASAHDVTVHPDPRRAGFYDLEAPDCVYLIHVSTGLGLVHFLAAWPKQPAPIQSEPAFGARRAEWQNVL